MNKEIIIRLKRLSLVHLFKPIPPVYQFKPRLDSCEKQLVPVILNSNLKKQWYKIFNEDFNQVSTVVISLLTRQKNTKHPFVCLKIKLYTKFNRRGWLKIYLEYKVDQFQRNVIELCRINLLYSLLRIQPFNGYNYS